MKNIIVKIILLFCGLQCWILQSIDVPWYHHCLNKNNNITYTQNCSKIALAENIRTAALIAYYRLTHKRADLHKVLDIIKNEFAEIELWMLELEQKALKAIKEKYQVSDHIWQHYLTDMHRIKTINKKKMTKKNANIIHDQTIPADIREMIISLLEHNNINPESVHLKTLLPEEKNNNNQCLLAQAHGTVSLAANVSHGPVLYNYHPYTINFFPILAQKTSFEKSACCAHEIQHLIQHHVITDMLLQIYLQHYYQVNIAEFKQTAEYHKFAQIHEAQAEILSAIQNPELAHAFKAMRQTSYYHNHLYEDHFFHLAYINALWKAHTWLEFFHHDGIAHIRNEWIEKAKTTINSLCDKFNPLRINTPSF